MSLACFFVSMVFVKIVYLKPLTIKLSWTVLLFVIQDTKVHFHLAEFCTEVSLQLLHNKYSHHNNQQY